MATVNLYLPNYDDNQCSIEPVEGESLQYAECLFEPTVADAVSEAAAELESAPMDFMPQVTEALTARVESELKTCAGVVAMPAWTRRDAVAVAKAIAAGTTADTERFIKYAKAAARESDRRFVRNVLAELSSNPDGIEAAGYILAGIDSPFLASRILYSIAEKNPIAAARIFNSYEYFVLLSGADTGDINEALNGTFPRGCEKQPSAGACYGPRIFLTYASASELAAADVHRIGSEEYYELRDLILNLFGEYDRDPTAGERRELEAELPIVAGGVFTRWRISYREDGRVEDAEYMGIVSRETPEQQEKRTTAVKLEQETENAIRSFFDNYSDYADEIEEESLKYHDEVNRLVSIRVGAIASRKLAEAGKDALEKTKTLEIRYKQEGFGDVYIRFSYEDGWYNLETVVGDYAAPKTTTFLGMWGEKDESPFQHPVIKMR